MARNILRGEEIITLLLYQFYYTRLKNLVTLFVIAPSIWSIASLSSSKFTFTLLELNSAVGPIDAI